MENQIIADDLMFFDSPGIRKYNNLVAIMQEAMNMSLHDDLDLNSCPFIERGCKPNKSNCRNGTWTEEKCYREANKEYQKQRGGDY